MSRAKSSEKKKLLGSEAKKNRRLPVFVISKTNRKITMNPNRRHWRTRKLKIKIK